MSNMNPIQLEPRYPNYPVWTCKFVVAISIRFQSWSIIKLARGEEAAPWRLPLEESPRIYRACPRLKALNLGQPGKRKLAWPITHRCIINHLPGCNVATCICIIQWRQWRTRVTVQQPRTNRYLIYLWLGEKHVPRYEIFLNRCRQREWQRK